MIEKKKTPFKRSPCPVANILDIVGDKWTLLVIRDLLMGNKTYGELSSSAEKIPTNILADRLKKLERGGLLVKCAYQQRPVRYNYELTEKGVEMKMVMASMVKWANKYIPGTYTAEQIKTFYKENKSHDISFLNKS